MDDLAEQIGELLQQLVAEGWSSPIMIVTIAANGALFAGRYRGALGDWEFEPLAEHSEGQGFALPINLFFVNTKSGDAARAVIAISGEKPVFV